jgi:hypothetical protein
MSYFKDILNKKISLSEVWKSSALSSIWSLFSKKKKEATDNTGPLIIWKTADVIKLRVSQDITGFEAMYGSNDRNGKTGGFEYQMIKKAMVNQLVEQLVNSDMIEWYKSPGYSNVNLNAEIWVAKK